MQERYKDSTVAMKKVMAFLQNQWFRDPEAARRTFERNPEQRERLIHAFLFMGCLTGQRLRAAFGDLCEEIVWEEVSTNVGGHSSTAFPADLVHIRAAIAKHDPDIILGFGKIACDALGGEDCIPKSPRQRTLILGVHPAARHGAMQRLHTMAKELRDSLKA